MDYKNKRLIALVVILILSMLILAVLIIKDEKIEKNDILILNNYNS